MGVAEASLDGRSADTDSAAGLRSGCRSETSTNNEERVQASGSTDATTVMPGSPALSRLGATVAT